LRQHYDAPIIDVLPPPHHQCPYHVHVAFIGAVWLFVSWRMQYITASNMAQLQKAMIVLFTQHARCHLMYCLGQQIDYPSVRAYLVVIIVCDRNSGPFSTSTSDIRKRQLTSSQMLFTECNCTFSAACSILCTTCSTPPMPLSCACRAHCRRTLVC
jgi:hypothetical protein